MSDPSETNEAYERLLRAQQLSDPELLDKRRALEEETKRRDQAARNRRKYPKVY